MFDRTLHPSTGSAAGRSPAIAGVLAAILTLLAAWSAATASPGIPEVRTLPNGLQVVLLEDHTLPLVAASLWVHAGSKDEIESSAGYAHFLEHLIQRGSESSGPFEYQRLANRWGGSLSVRSNYDRTYITLTGTSAALDDLLTTLAGIAFHAALLDKEVDLELGPLSQEVRNYYDLPVSVAFLETMRLTFPEHPYRFPMLGNYRTLGRLKAEPLMAFYRNLYAPNNMVVSLAGDFDPKKAAALVEASLGQASRSGTLPAKPALPAGFAGHSDVEKRLDLKETSTNLSFAGPGYRHPDRAAFEVIARALGDAGGSPIQAALVRSQSGSAPYVTYYGLEDCGMLYLGLKPDTPQLAYDAARAALLEIVDFKKRGLKEDAVHALTDRLVREARARAEQLASRAEDLGEAALFGGVRYYWDLPEIYARLTPADIARVAAKYLVQENLRLAVILPKGAASFSDEPQQRFHEAFEQLEKAGAGSPPDFPAVMFPAAEAARANPTAWGNPKDAQGLKAPQKTILANGLTVLALEDHRHALVGVSLHLAMGSGDDPPGKEGLANLTLRFLAAGAAAYAREHPATSERALPAAPAIQMSRDLTEVRFMTAAAGLQPALAMLASALLPAAPSEALFEAARRSALDALHQAGRDPANAALQLFRENAYAGHPYASPPEGNEAAIKAIALQDVKAFLARSLRPSKAVIAVAGDVGSAEVAALIRSLLEDWREGPASGGEDSSRRPTHAGPPAAVATAASRPGEYARQMTATQSQILIGVPGVALNDGDFPSLRFLGTALTVAAFEDMVFKRRAAFSAVALPEGLRQGGSLAIEVTAPPSRRDETVFDLQRLMRRLALEDLPEKDLQDMARMQAARDAAGVMGVAALASALAYREASGLGALTYRKDFEPPPLMTGPRLKDLAARYLRPEAWIVVKVGPPSS